jgi:integrase
MSNEILTTWKLPLSQQPRVTLALAKNGAGYVYWTNAKGTGKEELSTLHCPFEDGILKPERMAKLVYIAAAMAAKVAVDKSPRAVAEARDVAIRSYGTGIALPQTPVAGWDFQKGLLHYFEHGATSSKPQQKDERAAARRLISYLSEVCHIRLWSQLDWPVIQKALNSWADECHAVFSKSKTRQTTSQPKSGRTFKRNAARSGLPDLRTATRATNVLVRVAKYLAKHNPESGAVPAQVANASEIVQKIWQTRFKRNTPALQPRHSPSEFAAIVRAIYDPDFPMDPRLRMALLMNLERRVGQVLGVSRSGIVLKDGIPFTFTIPARGNKETPELCRFEAPVAETLLYEMQKGYLSEFEEAFQQKKITDYWLFPAGKLSKGRARFTLQKVEGNPWNERTLLDAFKELELRCGIEPVEGRALYGLKRIASDVSDSIETDEELKNKLLGHASAKTREIYLEITSRQLRQAQAELELQSRARRVALKAAEAAPNAEHAG